MWQKFTESARKVMFYGQEECQQRGDGYVSPEHLLLGLVRDSDSVAIRVLNNLHISVVQIRTELDELLKQGKVNPYSQITLTPRSKRVIDLAFDEARYLSNDYIGTEHLLLGLISESDSPASQILVKLGTTLNDARRAVIAIQIQDH